MEDDNGLELSLGLSFGGSSSKQKGKAGSLDVRTEDSDTGSKIVNDFKNFLNAGIPRHESGIGPQSDSVKPQENFFNDLSRSTAEAGASINLNGRNLWGGNYRSAETEEGKGSENILKRRMLFDEINHQKRHEKETHVDMQDKSKISLISIGTEEGSTADNEDVADSEIEGSTSRLVSHHENSKRSTREFPKEVLVFPEGRGLDLQVQKRLNNSSDNEFKLGNSAFGVPLSVQSMGMINGSHQVHGKDSNSIGPIGSPIISGHSLPGLVQGMPAANGERLETQPVIPANLPLMFGYSLVQLPTLDKDNSWGLTSHAQQILPSFAGRVPVSSDKLADVLALPQGVTCLSVGAASMQGMPRNLSELTPHEGRSSEPSKNDGKHVLEEGSSFQNEENAKGSGINFRAKEGSERSPAEGFSLDFSAIKPGIAADLKFGGCGSCPNLPWVSTTGPGPNGRTISGVTYRYSPSQIRIVCACHGSHMSPEDFVRHAAEDHANPESSTGLSTLPSKNPAASAQS